MIKNCVIWRIEKGFGYRVSAVGYWILVTILFLNLYQKAEARYPTADTRYQKKAIFYEKKRPLRCPAICRI
jgi:hypothetical protein